MKKKNLTGLIIAVVVIALFVLGCAWLGSKMRDAAEGITESGETTSETIPAPPGESASAKILPLGNPSSAATNPATPDNFLLSSNFYTVSYNRSKGIANWASWQLTVTDFGLIERQNDFRPDNRLLSGWATITPSDYSRSGFDRGHLCPSADRSASVEANSSTFLMTNITPQTPDLNQGPWEKLENYSRSLARRNNTLYIYAGQYGVQGKIKNKITIPQNYWKIILVVPTGQSINYATRVIAVDMPNVKGIKESNWRDYRTTVQAIEQKTGCNFFQNLSPALQRVLKDKTDNT